MSTTRDFSDSIKFEAVKDNLKRNNGTICCETCKKKLLSIDECHFDHIYPYAKGGKSNFENCQILCIDCNLEKNDKELKDFVLEKQAKQFLSGTQITEVQEEVLESTDKTALQKPTSKLTKEEFDMVVKSFIEKKGSIRKVDFSRAYNNLPSVWYVREYYGTLGNLQKAFGVEDLSNSWNRESIKQALVDFIAIHGDIVQKDLKKQNNLPSYPCILKHYPEYETLARFKREVLGLETVHDEWNKADIIEAGKRFVEKHGKVAESDLKAKNGLPTTSIVYKHFGTLANYQQAIGAPVLKNSFVSIEDIEKALKEYFKDKEYVIESSKAFFDSFIYSKSTIEARYGSFSKFCKQYGINVLNTKKGSYSKKEIDDAIHSWVFSGNGIPKSKDLSKLGFPSMSSIMKYYENWKEPFVFYKRIFDEANRNSK